MNIEETKAAYVAAQNLKVSADDFLNYQDKDKENTFALGVLALSLGEKLTTLAGMECKPATGNSGALEFVPKMSKEESALVHLLLNNYRKKDQSLRVTRNNNALSFIVRVSFEKFEAARNNNDDAFDQEQELYNLMGTIALALLNWNSNTPAIDEAAKHCLHNGHMGC
jgi:hypothetical protein